MVILFNHNPLQGDFFVFCSSFVNQDLQNLSHRQGVRTMSMDTPRHRKLAGDHRHPER